MQLNNNGNLKANGHYSKKVIKIFKQLLLHFTMITQPLWQHTQSVLTNVHNHQTSKCKGSYVYAQLN